MNEGLGLLTREQRQWVHSQKVLQAVLPRRALHPSTQPGKWGKFRRACFRLAYQPLRFERLEKKHYGKQFDYVILSTTFVNALMMALRPYPQQLDDHPGLEYMFSTIGGFFNGVYVVEAGIKISAFGRRYFEDVWNQFDFTMVLTSIAEFGFLAVSPGLRQFSFLRILRAARAVRLLRASRNSRSFRQMLATLYYAVPQLINMSLMIFMLTIIFATWGMILFNGIVVPTDADAPGFSTHANFVDFKTAATTILRIATGDGWAALYTDAYSLEYQLGVVKPPNGYIHLYFIALVSLFTYLIINVFVAVVITSYDEVSQSVVSGDDVQHFYDVWREFDLPMSGFMKTTQLGRLLCKLGPPFVSATEDGRLQLSRHQLAEYLRLLDVPNRDGSVHFLEVLLPVVKVLLPTELPNDVKLRLMTRWPELVPSLKQMPVSVSTTARDPRLVDSIMAQVTKQDLFSAPRGIGGSWRGITNFFQGTKPLQQALAEESELAAGEVSEEPVSTRRATRRGGKPNAAASLELYISVHARSEYAIQLAAQISPQLLAGFVSFHFTAYNVVFID